MNFVILDKFFSKTIGLMFSKPKIALFVFEKPSKPKIHNFFVFFSLDVYFLDENLKIIETLINFKPFSIIYIPKNKCKYMLEIPHKTTIKNKLFINN